MILIPHIGDTEITIWFRWYRYLKAMLPIPDICDTDTWYRYLISRPKFVNDALNAWAVCLPEVSFVHDAVCVWEVCALEKSFLHDALSVWAVCPLEIVRTWCLKCVAGLPPWNIVRTWCRECLGGLPPDIWHHWISTWEATPGIQLLLKPLLFCAFPGEN